MKDYNDEILSERQKLRYKKRREDYKKRQKRLAQFKKNGGILVLLIAIILIISLIKSAFKKEDIPEASETEVTENEQMELTEIKDDFIFQKDRVNEIQSEIVLLYNLDNDKIYFEKNIDKKAYPASLTKIMTQIITLERITENDLKTEIEMPQEIYSEMIEAEATITRFYPGERFLLEDLVYGNLIQSAGDASLILANYIAGSVDEFVDLMNQKARDIGMENTNFVNPTGLFHEEQYTTAEDLKKLMDYVLQNEEFTNIFKMKNYTTKAFNENSEELNWKSNAFVKAEARDNKYNLYGGKTGFIEEAGRCFIGQYSINRNNIILITLNAPYEDDIYTDIEDQFFILDNLERVKEGN